MKKVKPRTELILSGALASAIGIACLAGGLVARGATTDIRRMFASGNWSVATVLQKIKVDSVSDLETERERLLLTALGNTNKQCVELADLCVQVSHVFLLIGVCLCFLGSRSALLAIRLETKSQNNTSEGICQPADGLSKPST